MSRMLLGEAMLAALQRRRQVGQGAGAEWRRGDRTLALLALQCCSMEPAEMSPLLDELHVACCCWPCRRRCC